MFENEKGVGDRFDLGASEDIRPRRREDAKENAKTGSESNSSRLSSRLRAFAVVFFLDCDNVLAGVVAPATIDGD
jgi:hypothetical protein